LSKINNSFGSSFPGVWQTNGLAGLARPSHQH
jgi:hypothetical protein